jgi:hypothetical protein
MARSERSNPGTEYKSVGESILLKGIEKWAAARSSSGPSPQAADHLIITRLILLSDMA